MESSAPYSPLSHPPPYSECDGSRGVPYKGVHAGVSTAAHAAPRQQQNVIVVATVAPGVAPSFVYNPYPVAMTTAFVLSCAVFWFFGMLFGAIAFILAVMGSDYSTRGDVIGAMRLRNASYGVSVAGIVLFIVVVILVVVSKSQPHDQ